MVIGPRENRYPVILHYDDNGNPKRIAESNVLTVSSITATTVSALSYLGAPVGGVTYIGQLSDVDSNITDISGNLLIVSTDGGGNPIIAGIASSVFSTTSTQDHGALLGLSDDDHTQYLLADTSRAASGTLSATAFSATLYYNLPQALTGGDTGVVTLPGGSTVYLNGDGSFTTPSGSGSGVSTFIELTDTPASFSTFANNLVVVNAAANAIVFAASSPLATTAALANYIPTSVSSTFAQTTSLSNYIPTSVSSTFAQTTSLANYIPTTVSSSFAQTTSLTAHTGSAVHWTRTQLNSDYVNTSGDTMTGTLNGVSAYFSSISATNYFNVPGASLATSSASGLIPAFASNNQRNYFAGNGSWTYFSGVSGTSASEGFLKLAGNNQTIVGAALRSTDTRLTYGATITKGITIIEPTSLDDITMFICPDGQTYDITDYYFILMGTSPSVSCSFYTNTSRKTYDNLIDSFNLSSDSTYQVGSVLGEIAGGSLTAGGMLWVKINSVGGTVTEFHTTVTLTRTG